jgi:hypothetical protein
LGVVELTRINKDGDNRDGSVRNSTTNQRTVALVERTHRRHQTDRLAGTAELRGVRTPLLNRVDLNHFYDRVRVR